METIIQQLIATVIQLEDQGMSFTTIGIMSLLENSLAEEKEQLEEAFYSDESNFEQYFNNKFEK